MGFPSALLVTGMNEGGRAEVTFGLSLESLGVAKRYVVEAGRTGGMADGRIDVAAGLISTLSHESGRIELVGGHRIEKNVVHEHRRSISALSPYGCW